MKQPLLLAALAASSLTASAQVLMFDFGPATVVNAANSPYHTVNGSAGASWNKVQTADIAAGGLTYADGAVATGIAVNVGGSASSATLGTIALGTDGANLSTNALGGQTNTGVYGGTAGVDGLFRSIALTSPSRNVGSVGIQVTGLVAGTYDIYLTGRNTNTSSFGATGQTITAYAGAGTAGADFTFTGYSATGVNTFASATSFTSSWVQGENYIKLTVALAPGEALNIASAGGGTAGGTTADLRGFINSVQIVPVAAIPEPSAAAALAGLAGLGHVVSRRRRG